MSILIRPNFYVFIILILLSEPLFAQKKVYSDFYLIKREYEDRANNDSSALPLIGKYIAKAKREKKYPRLVEGYLDGIQYSPHSSDKLKYADSAIWASNLTKNDSIRSRAYLHKGIVYYFNFKKYKLALGEYMLAYEYSKKTNDQYHKNRLAYLIGVVKSYIGHYDEALDLFKQTKIFFETESKKNINRNLIYGNVKGYYNSLHQMAVCYRYLGYSKSADSLVNIGVSLTTGNDDYKQEYGYFLKERGISQFREKDYRNAIKSLNVSLISIANVDDFAWATVCYSYIGKSYKALRDLHNTKIYFQKVDSVFQKHNFILPELRNNYEELIAEYKKEKSPQKALYYTTQLIKADSIIAQDFAYLSSKIHREYDIRDLREEKLRLEQNSAKSAWVIRALGIIAMVLIITFFFRYRAEKRLREKYRVVEQKILNGYLIPAPAESSKKSDIEQKIVDDLLLKLEDFENNMGFLESGINLTELAAKFDTNHTYLSQVINEYKGDNFKRYLSALRIAFITKKLYQEEKLLSYKIETLARECGIASRSNFSDLFQEFNGMRPKDFIKKRREDIEDS
ncbi:helix-turn-helix transcriptional regulator [Pedobacter sp. ISL-68]|uniref:helix-turn-helix domain-containing protein n=1 Tax=unclassified Pedobacter TaxID=2628915 RepID=UPI001BEAA144|nr:MULTISPECIES: helix-turn-helix domain-containing protein [unclassified Pedobacter]MBT2559853.1 helix-turn-helix transcriptional regulator [Pedobacter sp. ISL-64]MBT2592158.1 helix-turn-helix transcriptional regulator [Pedobacter sp. ISL-68]